MTITGVNNGYDVAKTDFSAYQNQQTTKTKQTTTTTSGTKDTVAISDEAKQMIKDAEEKKVTTDKNIKPYEPSERTLTAEQEQSILDGTMDEDLALQALSIPGWFGDLMPSQTMLGSEVGMRYTETNQGKYDAMSDSGKAKVWEYKEILHEYYDESYDALGISNEVDYYYFRQDEELNKEMQMEVQQKLADNPRAVELMKFLNIPMPSNNDTEFKS